MTRFLQVKSLEIIGNLESMWLGFFKRLIDFCGLNIYRRFLSSWSEVNHISSGLRNLTKVEINDLGMYENMREFSDLQRLPQIFRSEDLKVSFKDQLTETSVLWIKAYNHFKISKVFTDFQCHQSKTSYREIKSM